MKRYRVPNNQILELFAQGKHPLEQLNLSIDHERYIKGRIRLRLFSAQTKEQVVDFMLDVMYNTPEYQQLLATVIKQYYPQYIPLL